MSLIEYTLLAGSSLFVIMDPIALIPPFLAMTAQDSAAQRIRTAKLACLVSLGILLLFALVGHGLFKLMGITLPAFKIAGGIVLLAIAMDMLHAKRSAVRETAEERDAGAAKDDIAITPLAVPMLAGPGAISTVVLLRTRAEGFMGEMILIGCITVVCAACYVILRFASLGVAWISPIAMRIVTRIMGLLLAAVAIQFILDALAEQKGKLF